MALLANSTIEVRPGAGADTNGGACVRGSTDLTLQNGAAYASTDIVTNGTTTITSASANWAANVVGNTIYITGGTAGITANWYRVVTRTSASALVLDRSTGLTAGTGATGNLGGALRSIGGLAAFLAAQGVTGMVCWVKSGTDTLTSTTQNIAGGRFNSGASIAVSIIGYNSARGDLNDQIDSANRPVIDVAALTSFTVVSAANPGFFSFHNIIVEGNSNSTITGFGTVSTYNCTARNCTTGFNQSSSATGAMSFCSATTCGTGFTSCPMLVSCKTKGSTTVGYGGTIVGSTFINCISIDDALTCNVSARLLTLINCTFQNSTADMITGASNLLKMVNCLLTDATNDAIDFAGATSEPQTFFGVKNAFFSNGTDYETDPPTDQVTGSITLAGDPYVNESTDDLAPNNGNGVVLHGVAVQPYGQIGWRDIGAVQHKNNAILSISSGF